MKKTNTTYWKEFRIGDLFDKLDLRFIKGSFDKTRDVSLVETPEFNLPLVNAKHFNNGIMYYGRVCDFESAEMTIDIVANGAASTGDVYPQPQRTGVLMDAYLIRTKKTDISAHMLYFLSTVIQRCIKEKYSYDDKCVWNKVKDEHIYLPAKDNAPDWQYMEDYMRRIEQQAKSAIIALNKTKYTGVKIDHSYWKEFEIENLFSVTRPPARLATEFEEGTIPFIASGNENNGVEKYVAAKNDILDKKGCISVSPVDGSCFYQPNDFLGRGGAGSSIIILRNSKLNPYSALFICSSLRRVFSKYNYSNMGSASKIKKEKVLLPATPTGEPDWKYMEMYMRGVEAITKEKISLLTSKKQEPVQGGTINNYGTVNIYEK